MDPDSAYKSIGVMRCANGDDRKGWLHLRGKLQKALRTISKLNARNVTRAEYGRVSNSLFGGTVMHYCQSFYASFDQFDSFEKEWRRRYSKGFEKGASTPLHSIYRSHRTHTHTLGLASLYVALNKAMSDVEPTAQREAALSTVALSLSKWGCCGDPNTWGLLHLRGAIEDSLRLNTCKYIGDAFLLACAIFEHANLFEGPECEDAISAGRVETFGRWEFASARSRDHVLHPSAKHFSTPRTVLLFEPVESELGGLGAPPAGTLLEAGVLALGHLCATGLRGGKCAGRWLPFEELAKACPELRGVRRARTEHRSLLEWLEERGVDPCEPESRRRFHSPTGTRRQFAFHWNGGGGSTLIEPQRGDSRVPAATVADDPDFDMTDFENDDERALREFEAEERVEHYAHAYRRRGQHSTSRRNHS